MPHFLLILHTYGSYCRGNPLLNTYIEQCRPWYSASSNKYFLNKHFTCISQLYWCFILFKYEAGVVNTVDDKEIEFLQSEKLFTKINRICNEYIRNELQYLSEYNGHFSYIGSRRKEVSQYSVCLRTRRPDDPGSISDRGKGFFL
jgi:hypothetical protein